MHTRRPRAACGECSHQRRLADVDRADDRHLAGALAFDVKGRALPAASPMRLGFILQLGQLMAKVGAEVVGAFVLRDDPQHLLEERGLFLRRGFGPKLSLDFVVLRGQICWHGFSHLKGNKLPAGSFDQSASTDAADEMIDLIVLGSNR